MTQSACIVVTVAMLFLSSWTREASAIRVSARISPEIIDEINQSQHTKDDDMMSIIITGFSSLSDTQIRQLSNLGTVSSVIGEIATLRLPHSRIWSLSQMDFVSRIDGGIAEPQLDISVPSIGANIVWETVKDAQGRRTDGSGVIIGIVDTGIDWKHPDFKFQNESSKILFLWDQTQTGTAPSGYGYGTEWTQNQIEAGTCTEKDTDGHGTHVAGIAAGTGRAREEKYVGVAPGAALLFVKSGRLGKRGWNFKFSEVLDGVTYIWRKAAALGRRVVISLSLGSHSGGHDGTSAVETGLDRLTSEGAIITVAAGNSGASKVHAEGRLNQGESVTLGFKADANETDFHVETWFSRSDVFTVSLTTPSGQRVEGPTSQASTSEGRVTILEDSTEKGKAWIVSFTSSKTLPLEGWTITLTAKSIAKDGVWDLWVGSYGELTTGSGYEITNRRTVSVPGTAKNIITVGAYVTKMRWTNKTGESRSYGTSEKEGDIAVFSSIGPTRDGRLKPEICAPGKGIVAPRSFDAPAGASDPDDLYCVKAGTSMAAPHMAGVVALTLQYNPYLAPNEAKVILQSTGRQDERTGAIDSTQGSMVWGYGKVDAKSVVTKFSGTSSIRIERTVAVLVAVIGATVVVIALVVRRKRTSVMNASVKPFKGTEVQTTRFCMNCGARLLDDSRYCHECGREVPRGD